MISFQGESLQLLRPELEPLMVRHWEEVCVDREFFRLNPNWEMFERLEDLGLVIAVTARDDTKLVGYVIYLLQPMMHYAHVRLAQEDAHYLMPEYRTGWNAVRMFRFAEGELRAAGAHATVVHTKAAMDRGSLFSYLGYQRHETLYLKRL